MLPNPPTLTARMASIDCSVDDLVYATRQVLRQNKAQAEVQYATGAIVTGHRLRVSPTPLAITLALPLTLTLTLILILTLTPRWPGCRLIGRRLLWQ